MHIFGLSVFVAVCSFVHIPLWACAHLRARASLPMLGAQNSPSGWVSGARDCVQHARVCLNQNQHQIAVVVGHD